MTSKDIRAILKPHGILCGVNLHPGEPTSGYHSVCIRKGTAPLALKLLRQAGATAVHAHAFGTFTESLNVKR